MTPMNKRNKQKTVTPTSSWQELTKAGNIYEPGNASEYKTGDWRTIRPIWDEEKCINCLFCWRYCPDASVIATDGKFDHFDYDHCKGCGICASVCPVDAIDMVSESEIEEKEVNKENE